MQTRLGGVGARNSPEACSTGWGRSVCRPGEGLEDAKPGRGRRGAGRQRKDSQPRGGEFAKWRKVALISRKVGGAVKSHGGGLQAPKSVGTSGEDLAQCGAALGVGMPTPAGQGQAGKAGYAGRGWGALLVAWPNPGGCARAAGPEHPEGGGHLPVDRGPHLPCPAP